MRHTVFVFSMCMIAISFGAGCSNSPKAYETSNLNSAAAQADAAADYWKIDGWGKVNPTGARNVAIVEFNVEFLTSDQANMDRFTGGTPTSIGGMAIKGMELGGMWKKTYQYDEQFMDDMTLALYDGFAAQLQAGGFNVVSRDALQADEEFQKIKGQDDDKSTKAKNRLQRTTGVIVNAPGFPRENVGFFASNAIANARTLPRLAHNVGADMVVSVFLRLGLTKAGQAVIAEGSTIRVSSDLEASKAAVGPDYYFKKAASMTSKKGMYAGSATTTRTGSALGKGKIMEVDSDSFRSGVMTMYPAYANMAIERIK